MHKDQKLKRFYQEVSVQNGEGGWAVLLDGKSVKSPLKRSLVLPSQALAEAIAEEWRGQEEYIQITAMNQTRMAFGALDVSDEELDGLRHEIAAYAGTDLLCYQEEEVQELAKRQAEIWGKWLGWAQQELGLRFAVACGIMPVEQPAETLERVQVRVAKLDVWELIPMGILVPSLGSYVLAEAVRVGALPVAEAVAASTLDADYQAERWGADEEAQANQAIKAQDSHAAATFLAALKS